MSWFKSQPKPDKRTCRHWWVQYIGGGLWHCEKCGIYEDEYKKNTGTKPAGSSPLGQRKGINRSRRARTQLGDLKGCQSKRRCK